MKANDKWYLKSILMGSAITTKQITKHMATGIAVSLADIRTVLTALAV